MTQKTHMQLALLAATIGMGVSTGTTLASDLAGQQYQQERPGLWQGLYLGAIAGYGTGHVKSHDDPQTFKANGGIGGAYAGYNWQINRFVLGVEGDYQLSGVSHRTNFGDESLLVRHNSFSSLRGRAGLTFDRMLVYGTLGYGWTNMKISYAGDTQESRRHTNSGFVYGGGLEYKLSDAWSLRGDILRYDASGHWRADDGSKTKLHGPVNEVRAGITWHFK